MKALILLSIPVYFAFVSISNANEYAATKLHSDMYCAKMKDGRMVVMHDGTALNTDITLAGGTQVKTDGTVIYKDGTRAMLREGECMDKNGKMENAKERKDKWSRHI